MNKVILLGRLTRDPEVRYGGADNRTAIARFTLAVDRRYKKAGDANDADFLNCTALGKLGEFVERYLKQGTKVILTGRIENDNYTNRDGQKVYSLRIVAEDIEFAESKSAGSGNSGSGQARQAAPAAPGYQAAPAAPAYQAEPGFQASPAAPSSEAGFGQAAPQDQTQAPDGFMNVPDGVEDSELPFN